MIFPFDAWKCAPEGRCHNQIANIAPVLSPFKMSIEIIREENCVAKFRSEGTQDHELVVDVRTEQTDGANSTFAFAPPPRVFIFKLTRKPTEEVRLIQSFGRLYCSRSLRWLSFLRISRRICLGWIAGQTPIDSMHVTKRADRVFSLRPCRSFLLEGFRQRPTVFRVPFS
jgi:hypothetical protein